LQCSRIPFTFNKELNLLAGPITRLQELPKYMKRFFTLLSSLLLAITLSAQEIVQELDNYLMKKKKNSFNGTVLIAQRGRVLLYKGYGFKNTEKQTLNDTGTIYRIGSLSKSFTASLVMMMVEQGALSLKDPINKFLPDYPHGDSVTIEHLLTHCSGIKEYLQVKAVQQIPDGAPPVSMDTLIGYFRNEPLSMRPGQKFAYSNSNYILLAAIIERVTGKKFEDVMRDKIFNALSMSHSGFDFKHLSDTNKATGHLSISKNLTLKEDFDSTYAPGCGSMFSTVMDLYRFYQALYNGSLLTDSTREQAFLRRKGDYGYGWFNEKKSGRKSISHAGGVPGFLANLQFYPDDGVCIIILSNGSERDIFIDSDKLANMVHKKQ
jgi:CubicO group peptidase (beta-lactamase class C family)